MDILKKTLRGIGTIKRGNQVIGVIVSDEDQNKFQAAFAGLLHKPIVTIAVPVIFDLFQSEAEATYEKSE